MIKKVIFIFSIIIGLSCDQDNNIYGTWEAYAYTKDNKILNVNDNKIYQIILKKDNKGIVQCGVNTCHFTYTLYGSTLKMSIISGTLTAEPFKNPLILINLVYAIGKIDSFKAYENKLEIYYDKKETVYFERK